MSESIPQNPDIVGGGGIFNYALIKTLAENNPNLLHLFLLSDEQKISKARKGQLAEDKKFFGEKINKTKNPEEIKKLISLPENVEFYSLNNFCEKFRGKIEKLFMPVYPSHAMREVLEKIVNNVSSKAFSKCEVLSASKGMELKSFKMMHEVIEEVLDTREKVVAMLGGNIAFDMIQAQPMITEFAGSQKRVNKIAELFTNPNLRIYKSFERRILDIAGPIKNIHSFAAGIANTIGDSTVAAITTRGLAEYERIAYVAQHKKIEKQKRASAKTHKLYQQGKDFRVVPVGKGVVSDYQLFKATRNFWAGEKFIELTGAGFSAVEACQKISKTKTVESLSSAIPMKNYVSQIKVEAPIIEIIAAILEGKIDLKKAIKKLMERPTK